MPMPQWLERLTALISSIHPLLVPAAGLTTLLLFAWLISLLSRGVVLLFFRRAAAKTQTLWDDKLLEHKAIKRMVQVTPAVVTYLGAPLVPELSDAMVEVVRNVSVAYMALMVVLALNGLLSAVNDLYETRDGHIRKPIKSYIQISKIVLFIFGGVFAIAALLDKSPLILLSGFGALTAVILVVFKDTLLSLVASIQLSSLNMLRVGDWIEMPDYNADGDVIDVELHTVRVQNWDKTITTIPTHKFISDSFKNWRGMSLAGGRRIKRSLMIDQQSIAFLTDEQIEHFQRFTLLREYLANKTEELRAYNAALGGVDDAVNLRRLTNIGTFRAYLFSYLKNHPEIHDHMTLLVRQLEPTPEGLPVELYCFTTTVQWGEYERIQSDLFDHVYAILPEFGLRAYQHPSGADLMALPQRLRPVAAAADSALE